MMLTDDKFIIDMVLQGDTSAFAALVEKHKDMVFTIAIKIVRNREEAEEIAQDAFMKAYAGLKDFKGESRFSTWLYRIAYNAAISQKRKPRQEFTAISEEMIDRYTTDLISLSVSGFTEEEQISAINHLMEKLPEEESLLLTLFYKNEKSVEEISGITGYSQSNVKVKLYRIRKKLYDELQRYFNLS